LRGGTAKALPLLRLRLHLAHHAHTHTHTHTQTEKARHILQVRQKILDQKKLERGVVRMPSDLELNKLSDEHKAMLAEKCVLLLMRGKTGAKEEMGESKPVSGRGREKGE